MEYMRSGERGGRGARGGRGRVCWEGEERGGGVHVGVGCAGRGKRMGFPYSVSMN